MHPGHRTPAQDQQAAEHHENDEAEMEEQDEVRQESIQHASTLARENIGERTGIPHGSMKEPGDP
jgi:hypothetical protein